jgi:tetratricopeptide (TPR) repeat protein
MADSSTQLDLLGVIQKAFGWITAAIGFTTGAVSCAKMVSGDARLVFLVLLWSGAVVLWGSCFYIFFFKTKRKMAAGMTSRLPQKEYAFPPYARRIAQYGIFIIPFIAVVSGGIRTYYRNRPSSKIIVSVANFQNLDATTSATTERLLAQLRTATQPYAAEIEIDPLKMAITEQDGGSEAARKIARDRKSAIVIWGWNNKDFIRAYFELLMNNESYLAELKGNQTLDLIVAGHETFKVQMGLSEDMVYLTLLAVGLARYESQDYDGATRLLRDALSHLGTQRLDQDIDYELKEAIGYFYLGRAFADQGNYNQAIVSFLEAIKHKPDYEAGHLHLGYAYQAQGDTTSAKRELETAIRSYDTILTNNPKDVDAYLNRGSAHSNLNNLEKALADYDKALQLRPDSARGYNNRGIIFYKTGEMDRAFSDFNRAIDLRPRDASSFSNRGTAYSRQGKFDEALRDFDKVIKYRPNSSLSYLNRAFVFFDKVDYKSAIKDYDEALKLEPSNFRAYRNRAWAHLFVGENENAAHDAQSFLNLRRPCNNNADFQYVAILGYVGFRMAGRNAEAQNLLESALAECGPSGWQHTLLRFLHHDTSEGQLLAEAGQDNDQLTEANTYIGLDLLFSGRRNDALRRFQWVKDHGNRDFDEYHLVLTQVARLNTNPGS